MIKFPRPKQELEPDEDVVAILAELLVRAEAGKLQSLVVVTISEDGTPELAMKMDRGHAASVIGGLHVAGTKLARLLDFALSDETSEIQDDEEL
ncbi:hypothetical protein [Hyphomicrobium sp. 99]|uniref:hypothetical protein n=1 Tax=Hyphomicrobium sp. 99 TaxID=1163419 RepID=UPI001AEBE1EC|nr:hypothetical protein [Hyphomicrobium sp. 99]